MEESQTQKILALPLQNQVRTDPWAKLNTCDLIHQLNVPFVQHSHILIRPH